MPVYRFEEVCLSEELASELATGVLGERVRISNDAETAIARAASSFIVYLTTASTAVAKRNNRKSLNGQDILTALNEVDLSGYIDLQESFNELKAKHKEQKAAQASKKRANANKKK